MCGIVTIFAYDCNSPTVDREELLRIRDRMSARGPDGCGTWYSTDGRVGLGHRRLAIIDLSQTGAQPMLNEEGSLVVTFNGEIYNYRELRVVLEEKGYRFHSSSDTEVLLHLYEEKGPEMVHDLRGMYAFAIWDSRKEGLFLARDPFGIKPIYYSDDGGIFRAASQVKALMAGGKISIAPEPAGHVGFFLWGHVPEPYTFYRGIRALPAGTSMWVDRSGVKDFRTFCCISLELAKAAINPLRMEREEMLMRLREALLDSVRHHLIADVPVGIFLSSGLDSTTIAALAAETGVKELHTITLGFKEYRGTINDEVPLAEQVASDYGTKHKTIWIEKTDFNVELELLLSSMDQPTTDGVNSYWVSKAAVRAGLKVAISGLGGDEIFGGYPSFSQLPRMVKLLGPMSVTPWLGRMLRTVSVKFLKQFTSQKYAGIFEYGGTYSGAYLLRRGMFMPWELPELLDAEMVREGWRELQTLVRLEDTVAKIGNDHMKVSALEMIWYMRNQLLRDTDWASMAQSLEIRVPLVDLKLLREVAPLLCTNSAPNKHDMATTPSISLPGAVLNRRKTGFSVPIREWLSTEKGDAQERSLRRWAKKIYAANTGASSLSEGAHIKERSL